MKLTKKMTINEIITICCEVGYYMPYERVKEHVNYSIYKIAVSEMVKKGLPNARKWFSHQKYLLKLREAEAYDVALLYGTV